MDSESINRLQQRRIPLFRRRFVSWKLITGVLLVLLFFYTTAFLFFKYKDFQESITIQILIPDDYTGLLVITFDPKGVRLPTDKPIIVQFDETGTCALPFRRNIFTKWHKATVQYSSGTRIPYGDDSLWGFKNVQLEDYLAVYCLGTNEERLKLVNKWLSEHPD